jgi:hypothetical protein
VFPPEAIDKFTVGRASELAAVDKRLEEVQQGSSRHLFVEGSYGHGKSHTLKAIESLALRKGFAVSWVVLDGYNHAFNHPTRYFHSFLENLRVPSLHVRGLGALLRYWLRSQQAAAVSSWAKQSQSWLKYSIPHLEQVINGGEVAPYVDGWLESRDISSKSGKNWFETIGYRMQATAGLVRAAGHHGVVYLFDEVETIATLLWGVRQRYLSYEFLNLLVDARKHAHCLFAFAATPDFGTKISGDREDVGNYAFQYPDGCRFIQKWHEGSLDFIRLRKLAGADFIEICKKLRHYHEAGFSWNAKGRLTDRFIERYVDHAQRLSLGTRDVIKAFVHLLEISEQHRDFDVTSSLQSQRAAAN